MRNARTLATQRCGTEAILDAGSRCCGEGGLLAAPVDVEVLVIPKQWHCPDGCSFSPVYDGRIGQCGVCGLGRTLNAGAAAEAQDYLNATSEQREFKRNYFRRLHARALRDLAPGRVLDIGCSDGLLLDVLSEAGWQTLGIDAYRDTPPRADVLSGNFLQNAISGRFDLITAVHSFEHLDDPVATLERCASLLHPGGRLFIVVPNFAGWWSRAAGPRWPWLNPADHRFHYTEGAMRRLLEQNGFVLLSVRTWSRFTPSIAQMYLSERGFFEGVWCRWRLLRSAAFRISAAVRRPANVLCDVLGRGAELQVLAVRAASVVEERSR